jgi:UDP-GlcNAc:undecaprenyl-phosphate GlcNAc-1-phosphate transferase
MGEGLFAFVVTFLGCAAIFHGRHALEIALDPAGAGPQKFHSGGVPRIGGLAILAGIAAPALLLRSAETSFLLLAIAAAMPVFAGGLIEDLTKRFSAQNRLWSAFFAAAIAFLLLDARVTDLHFPGSSLLGFPVFSFLFTVFAVGGFAHALNIVDGFNGLSGMVAMLMLTGLAVVAAKVGDGQVLLAAMLIGGAVLGFLFWNYPRGLIFAGDSGAYLLGFLIAVLAVMLAHRNSEVSPWFPLVLLLYPVVECCFSMYRKKLLRGISPGKPDGVHLHMLIYKRLLRRYSGTPSKWKANSLTTPYLVVLSALTIVPGVLLWDNTGLLQLVAASFTVLYIWLYWRIVRFRTPRILVFRKVPKPAEVEASEKGQATSAGAGG